MDELSAPKAHRPRQAGAKVAKRAAAARGPAHRGLTAPPGASSEPAAAASSSSAAPRTGKNARAFGVAKFGRLHKTAQRTLDRAHRAHHVPLADAAAAAASFGAGSAHVPPPALVCIMGPPRSGKTTLLKSLVRHYTRQGGAGELRGPVSVLAGTAKRCARRRRRRRRAGAGRGRAPRRRGRFPARPPPPPLAASPFSRCPTTCLRRWTRPRSPTSCC